MSIEQPPEYRVRSAGSRGGKWRVCPGTGTEPVSIVQPERRNKKGRVISRVFGVCRRCRRVIAAPGGLLINHAPYETRR